MKKLVEVPMRDLTDALGWHLSQVERYENLKKKYTEDPMAQRLPRWYETKMRDTQRKVDFYQSVADVIQNAINKELQLQDKLSAVLADA